MEDIPIDILPEIFHYCNVRDMLNVACCSKQYHQLMIPLLWRCVRVPLLTFLREEPTDQMLQNLLHTSHLTVFTVDEEAGIYSWPDDDQDDAMTDIEKLLLQKSLLNIMSHCNPLKVTSFVTDMICEGAMDVLSHIKKLSLYSTLKVDVAWLRRLQNLMDLELNHCELTDECLQLVLLDSKLERLEITSNVNLSDTSISHIGTMKKVHHLRIHIFDKTGRPMDTTPLGKLPLTHLTLCANHYALNHLCRTLTYLKELDLSSSHFTSNDALLDIGCLKYLKKLNLYDCIGVTSAAFVYVCMCPSLRKLTFSSEMCLSHSGSHSEIDHYTSELSQMKSLKEVCVFAVANTACGTLRSLTQNAQWTIRFKNIDILHDKYTFLR